jgi:hypothetical protein
MKTKIQVISSKLAYLFRVVELLVARQTFSHAKVNGDGRQVLLD